MSYKLPEDYVQFLLLHNGAVLFHDGYCAGVELYSLEQILEQKEDREYWEAEWGRKEESLPTQWIIIGIIGGDDLILDLFCNEVIISRSWEDSEDRWDYTRYHFGYWLYYLILSQGNPFWLWHLDEIQK